MTRTTILLGKMITIGLWGLVVMAAIGRITPPFQTVILAIGLLVFLVHCFEVAYLFTRHRHRVTAPWKATVGVLVYGVFSLAPLIIEPESPGR